MHIKDHYKTLGVSQAASLQDIKKAYRRLAFEYHPDQNQDNVYAEANFKEIQEAYSILSHANKRRVYDEERWLMGMGNKARDQEAVTPHWILHECKKLSRHMATIDTYRMSHRSLHDYIFLLLSNAHMGVLKRDNDTETNIAIIREILNATGNLEYEYMADVSERLKQIAADDAQLNALIEDNLRKHKKRAGFDKYFAPIIIAFALVLALIMYLYGRRN